MTSLRHRLTLPVLLVVVTMVSCYSWFIYERLASELERQFLLRGQLLLKSMVYALEMEHHEEDLPRVIQSFASEKGVKDIVVVAGSPLIIKAANPPSWLNASLENLPKEMQGHLLDAIQGKKEVTHFIRQEEFSLHLARPLLLFSNDSQGPQPGALLVKLQAITMQSELAAMKYAMMGTLLTMASFSMALIWLLLRRNVFIPLQTLISAMSRRAQGDFNAYAPLSSQDEIGQMAFAYNDMLDALASYETTLLEEKERAEQLLTTLQDSEEQFRISFENAPFGMCLVGLDQKIQKTNAAFCRLANRGEEALLGAHFFAVMSYEEALTTTEAPDLEKIAATPFRMEMGFSHSDSPCQWAEVGLSLVRDGRGYPRFYIVQIQDVTSRKSAEQEILHRLEVEKAVCLSSQELISRRHPIHTISLSALALAIGADRACIFKISPNDSIPKVLDHWHHPDLPPCPCHNKQDERYEWLLSHFTHKQFGGGIMINHVPSLPDSQAEKSFLVKQGILGWICLPIRYSKGELRGFIAFDRITKTQSWQEEDFSAIQVAADLLGGHWERLETEEEKLTIQERAMRTSHLASLGMLSAGVAHEINNPNNLIMFNAPLLGKFWDGVIPILEDKRQREGSFTLGGLP
ncbi:MAG: PAS domain S-box protein, partial [Magnetococcales bacterium]|nr:PAS domain S-box protein [Magnetococcales bacterium]